MKELNGIIIDGVVYLAETNTEPKPRCASCELACCDGEKMRDTICANILSSNEYFVKSGTLSALSHQWVSVEDALPEPHEEVLCMMKSNGAVVSGFILKNGKGKPEVATDPCFHFEDYEGYEPTHWCPIPPLNPDDKTPAPADL